MELNTDLPTLIKDLNLLRTVLQYHVTNQVIGSAEDFESTTTIVTRQTGSTITVDAR